VVENRAQLETPKESNSTVYGHAIHVLESLNDLYSIRVPETETAVKHSQRSRQAIAQIYRDILEITQPYITDTELLELVDKFIQVTGKVHSQFRTTARRNPQVLYEKHLKKR
jgi:hypothetical protein